MNNNILIVAAAGIGILAGAGGTYLIMPEPEPVVRAPTDAEIAALIAANPSMIPEPPAPVLGSCPRAWCSRVAVVTSVFR